MPSLLGRFVSQGCFHGKGARTPAPQWLRGALPVLLAVLMLSTNACGSGGEVGEAPAADTTATPEEDDGPEFRYELVMRGMLRDTLRGYAEFGVVFDPVTRREQWVLSMRSGSDVTSGVYLARPDTTRPQAGTHQIVSRRPLGAADSMRAQGTNTFTMIYRAGMRRSFHSGSGTLELATANDTLLEGTIQATLQGTASPPGQPPREGTITLEGEFRAEKGTVGFMFGV